MSAPKGHTYVYSYPVHKHKPAWWSRNQRRSRSLLAVVLVRVPITQGEGTTWPYSLACSVGEVCLSAAIPVRYGRTRTVAMPLSRFYIKNNFNMITMRYEFRRNLYRNGYGRDAAGSRKHGLISESCSSFMRTSCVTCTLFFRLKLILYTTTDMPKLKIT